MKEYWVFYLQSARHLTGDVVTVKDFLLNNYKFVKRVQANDLEDVFRQMQGEIWSPNGEARSLIAGLGLTHTSMSVFDVIFDKEAKKYHLVMPVGFRELQNAVED